MDDKQLEFYVDKLKEEMSWYISFLTLNGMRKANIEIELIHHIKKELSKGGH